MKRNFYFVHTTEGTDVLKELAETLARFDDEIVVRYVSDDVYIFVTTMSSEQVNSFKDVKLAMSIPSRFLIVDTYHATDEEQDEVSEWLSEQMEQERVSV